MIFYIFSATLLNVVEETMLLAATFFFFCNVVHHKLFEFADIDLQATVVINDKLSLTQCRQTWLETAA